MTRRVTTSPDSIVMVNLLLMSADVTASMAVPSTESSNVIFADNIEDVASLLKRRLALLRLDVVVVVVVVVDAVVVVVVVVVVDVVVVVFLQNKRHAEYALK